MPDLEPVDETNLDGYGAPPIPWAKALDRLENTWKEGGPGPEGAQTPYLSTMTPDGGPHVMPVGAIWLDGAYYFTSGPGTRKAKNIARDPRCAISMSAKGIDLVVEGLAEKATDDATLKRLADAYATIGWPVIVRDGAFTHDFSAPSAGPPPWELYRVNPTTIFGLGTEEPYGATRWRF